MAPLSASTLAELKAFVLDAKRDPQKLHDPSLTFLVDFLRDLGANVPKVAPTNKAAPAAAKAADANADLRDEECVPADEATQDTVFQDKGEPTEQVSAR